MKNVSKKLGVDTKGQVLTKALCLMKVKALRTSLARGEFKEGSELRRYAVYYANWYTWRAKQFDKKKPKRVMKAAKVLRVRRSRPVKSVKRAA